MARREEDDLADEWLGQTQADMLQFEGVVDKLSVPEDSLLFAEMQPPAHLGQLSELEKVQVSMYKPNKEKEYNLAR